MPSRRRRLRKRSGTLQPLEERCLLSSITVTSTSDEVVDDGQVTLREAIIAANEDRSVDGSTAGSGADEIVFAAGVDSIALTGGELQVTSDLRIVGGAVRTIVDAQEASRVFRVVGEDLSFAVENMKFLNGEAEFGGALLADRNAVGVSVTVINSEFSGNHATRRGGAVYVRTQSSSLAVMSSLTVEDSLFEGNQGNKKGGAIYGFGAIDVSVSSSHFKSNTSGNGGALIVEDVYGDSALAVDSSSFTTNNNSAVRYRGAGSVTIDSSTFDRNVAPFGGAAVLSGIGSTIPIVSDSVFTGNVSTNTSPHSGGGAILAGRSLNVSGSTFSDNHANGSGGAMRVAVQLRMDTTELRHNSADADGGAIHAKSTFSDDSTLDSNSARGHGGAIYVTGDTLFVATTSVINNQSVGRGGGLYANLGMTVSRSSVVGNRTTGHGSQGGGLYTRVTTGRRLLIENSTVSGNTTEGRDAHGGGVAANVPSDAAVFVTITNSTVAQNTAEDASGGGLHVLTDNRSAILTVTSSVIAKNAAADSRTDIAHQGTPPTASFTHSFVGNNAGTELNETGIGAPDADGNLVGSSQNPIDPKLHDVAVFDGLFAMNAPMTGSPVLDAGSNPEEYELDNRGNPRQSGAAVDMGAFEGTAAVLSIEDVSVPEGDSGQSDATFTIALNGTVDVVLTVAYATEDANARTGDSDYEATSGSVDLGPTDGSTAPVNVPVNGDTNIERMESFHLNISGVTGSADVGLVLRNGLMGAIGTIETDDRDGVRLDEGEVTISGRPEVDDVQIGETETELLIDYNGVVHTFLKDDVDIVFANLFEGDDIFSADDVKLPVRVVGGVGNDQLTGGRGSDTLVGSTGDDTIRGGRGFDFIAGGGGVDSLRGDDGDDTINGGDGDDLIISGAGSDLVSGGEGHDSIATAKHSDTVYGGGGDDTVRGGSNTDLLFGDAGDDSLRGEGHDDTLMGGEGNDHLLGGDDDDYVRGGAGNDTMRGHKGDDWLYGDEGNDLGYGAQGDDIVVGGEDDDRLEGAAGRDLIVGRGGLDTLLGGDGDDLLIAGYVLEVGVDAPNFWRVRQEWATDARDYAQRVKNLKGAKGQSSNRLNGSEYVRGVNHSDPTVSDDGVGGDILRGGDGLDLFFAHKRGTDLDRVYRTSGESLVQI